MESTLSVKWQKSRVVVTEATFSTDHGFTTWRMGHLNPAQGLRVDKGGRGALLLPKSWILV